MRKVRLILTLTAMFLCIVGSCSDDGSETGTGSSQEESSGSDTTDEEEYTTDVEYYEFAPQLGESTIYAVKAAGKYITVLPTDEPHLAWIGVDEGKVKFEISLQSGSIETVDVRPLGKEYNYTLESGKLTIGLEKYDRVSVEVNGDIDNPLFIFVNPIDTDRPSSDDSSVLYFSAGEVYEYGSITLSESCKEVYLEPGAVVYGNIYGGYLDGVKIHGGGFLNSTGYTGVHSGFYQPFSIALQECTNSEVTDITNLFAAGGWSSLYTGCSDTYITNVHTIGIQSSPGTKTNNDSMDIIGANNLHVSKCFLYGHDDCYCIKSQKFYLKGEVDGVYFEDCIGWNVDAGNTFEIGYETGLSVSNVQYKDIYAIHSGTGSSNLRRAGISIHNGAAGTISNVSYENVWLEDVMEFGIYLACLSHSYNIGYDDDGNEIEYSPGYIDGVTYDNVNILSVRSGKGYCVIQGYDSDHVVSNITFNDLYWCGSKVTSLDDSIWSIKKNYSNITFN